MIFGKLDQDFIELSFTTKEEMTFINRERSKTGKGITNALPDIDNDILRRLMGFAS